MKKIRIAQKYLIPGLMLACLLTPSVLLADGQRARALKSDQTFGQKGQSLAFFEEEGSYTGRDVEILPDGKILVVGEFLLTEEDSDGRHDFFDFITIVRYNSDGFLDETFGAGGRVITKLKKYNCIGDMHVEIDQDGRIVVAGFVWEEHTISNDEEREASRLFISRYNPDGSLDDTFGDDGIVLIDHPKEYPFALDYPSLDSMAIDHSGRIVLSYCLELDFPDGIEHKSYDNFDVVHIARYDHNGAPDASFGENGMVATGLFGVSFDSSLAIDASGKIVISGVADWNAEDDDTALERYNDDGSLDTDFGKEGRVAQATPKPYQDSVVKVLADGKIMVAGTNFVRSINSTDDMYLVRYNHDGSFDRVFRIVWEYNSTFKKIGMIHEQSDGKILVFADSYIFLGKSVGNSHLLLARYNRDGSLDRKFGFRGMMHTDFSGDAAFGSAVQYDGKILLNQWIFPPDELDESREYDNFGLGTMRVEFK